ETISSTFSKSSQIILAMATHSYVIRDLDDDDDNDDNSNQRESLNLFSKRMKIDDLSKNNDTHSYESNPSNPIPETDSSSKFPAFQLEQQ
ncbi:unnamed protein product, partial [Rotaria magnacalcarata]